MAARNVSKDPKKGAELEYTRVADELRRMILSNELKPGEWIRVMPTAKQLGVSGQPIREALQLLNGEGLVKLIPNCGAQVHGLTRERLFHIYEVRAALESYVSRRFAEHASYLDLVALEKVQKAHDDAMDARDIDEVLRLNLLFHDSISGHSDNAEMLGHINRYRALSRTIRFRIGYDDAYYARVRSEHYELLSAFRRHDALAAAEIGLRHVLGTKDELLENFDLVLQ
jgi:DNA-binding GntR family transcriptional regulator